MDGDFDPKLGLDVGEGIGVNELKMGVVTDSVTATGETYPEGVDACSVAYRSGDVEEAGRKSPHPSMKNSKTMIQMNLVLLMFHFDGFKVKFLA